MHKPTAWKDDPECGHLVAHPHQTHYCTYIRAPKLLSLKRQPAFHPDELLVQRVLQAYELWFLVLVRDLEATLVELTSGQPWTRQPVKLLDRCSRLIRLLDRQTDIAESFLVHDLGLRIPLRRSHRHPVSPGFQRLSELSDGLEQLLGAQSGSSSAHGRSGRDYLGRFRIWARRYRELTDQILLPDSHSELDYSAYVFLEELSQLQQGVKSAWTPQGEMPQGITPTEHVSPDELMFIVVHQAFELWFNALLHELDKVLEALQLDSAELGEANQRLGRVIRVQKFLVEQIHIPATMHPVDFLQFRQQTVRRGGQILERGLSPASGTESYQFREIEIIGGLKHSVAFREFLHGNSRMHIRFLTPKQEARMAAKSLPELFDDLLEGRGVEDVVDIFSASGQPNEHADLAALADSLLEFDQFFQLWRVNHLTMVQFMIGRKSGTGFLGPEYLRETVGMGMQGEDDRLLHTPQMRPRFFEKLWEVRTRFEADQPVEAGSGRA